MKKEPTIRQKKYWESLKGKMPKNIDGLFLGRYWNKGKSFSIETKEKMRKAKFGYIPWNKGKKTGVISPNFFKKGHRPWNKEKKDVMPPPWNKGLKGYHAGKKCHLWKGGITPLNNKIRKSLEYKLWRKAVFERDNFTCIWCKKRGVKLEVDHIKPFCDYPELRFAIDNGRTLCRECHKKTNTYMGRARWNKKEKGK